MNIHTLIAPAKHLCRQWLCPLLVLCAAHFPAAVAQDIQHTWEGVERIIAVGDVHGDFKSFRETLKEAGVISGGGKWRAGAAHLVQMGDIPGYGEDTTEIMRFLMELEEQALEAGGRVHVLIGDHEAKVINGDLTDVPEKEFRILKNGKSKKVRDQYFRDVYEEANYVSRSRVSTIIDDTFRDNWIDKTPLGYVEHRLLWALDGEFGAWVMGHNAMIRINNILFSHAGLGPNISGNLGALNNRVRAELAGDHTIEPLLHTHHRGPLMYDGHILKEAALEEPNVDIILRTYDVDHLVVGHTTGPGIVYPRFNGKVINIDSGISEHFGGYRTSLDIRDGTILINIGKEGRLLLPETPAQEEAYFKVALGLTEDPPEALVDLVESYR